MKNLKIKSLGPIENADITFGDLTFLVGPQASGKSIFIQTLKLLVDKFHIRKTLEQYNYVWDKDTDKILDLYYGEGMCKIWKANTEITLDSKRYNKSFLETKSGRNQNTKDAEETLFYVPAQRILSVSDGRPKPFMEFDSSAPYVLRQYSETLRLLLQNGMVKNDSIFPISNRLKEPLRKSFNDSIFHDGKVVIDDRSGQRKLRMEVDGMSVPFITWSAGQKEFMPLLLGFYYLCPPSKTSRKDDYKYVVIEEPEMGLHPQAIISIILQIIDLLSREYKVIVSTHSPVLLEFAWVFNYLKTNKVKDSALLELFNLPKTQVTEKLFKNILTTKTINTFYFDRKDGKVTTKDISTLDAGNEDAAIAEWGGLSTFVSRATDIILKYQTNED
ncbi:MAG: ATP-binding protein [Bacteroidia bacterium]|nr:ATP-binding protein [Bacteroidia bacterium]